MAQRKSSAAGEVVNYSRGVVSRCVVDDDAVGIDARRDRERNDARERVAHKRCAIVRGDRDSELDGHVVMRAATPRAGFSMEPRLPTNIW